MKNRKNSSTGDLEAVSLVAGVILVLCFGMMIFDLYDAGHRHGRDHERNSGAGTFLQRKDRIGDLFYSGVRGASAALCAASVLAGLRIYEK